MHAPLQGLDALDRRLLNDFQRGFPLVERPYAEIGARLGTGEADVLERYRRLARAGIVSRIGVVFRPNTAGASLLAAFAVPPDRLDAVARWLGGQPEVNHNYEREHRFNLWFVLAARSQDALEAACARIEAGAGLPMLRLPLLEEFHIDLGFDLETGGRAPRGAAPAGGARIDEADRPLLSALQEGFPLVPQPFEALAQSTGRSAVALRQAVGRWVAAGIARRVGVVVRHRPLGYGANAMVVWDVPDEQAGATGRALAGESYVTLCYRRPRRLPDWPYNLFTMVHGRERRAVRAQVRALRLRHGLAAAPHALLFSRRCYTQRGARYG
jgi:DNA-binding Lrp family transcriptional regulator